MSSWKINLLKLLKRIYRRAMCLKLVGSRDSLKLTFYTYFLHPLLSLGWCSAFTLRERGKTLISLGELSYQS